jgi:serine/threonine-protein kinase
LKKVALTGGSPVPVARLNSFELGATWAADGTIVFATSATATGLQRVSAQGGMVSVVTRPDRARGEANHWWPESLPGGQVILYTVTAATGGLDAASIAVLDLRSGKSTVVLQGGSHAQYVASGHLVYGTAGTLRAVAFNLVRTMVVGTSEAVVPEVVRTSMGAVDAVLARDGTLVYVTGRAGSGAARTLVWVDRQGHELPTGTPPRFYAFPRVSPDGARIATMTMEQNPDIWLWHLARPTLTRLTTDPAADTEPVWMPDGRRVVFSSNRAGTFNLYSLSADGTGDVERLTDSPNPQFPAAVTPDGTQVVFTELSSTTGQDVMALRLDGRHQVVPVVQTAFDERNATVSPDGRWLAYEANESGSFEIYLRPFPDVNGGHVQLSTNGGTQPLWTHSGEELFYLAPDGTLMRVTLTGGPAQTPGAPTRVFDGRYIVSVAGNFPRNYDIAADDQRFLMVKLASSETDPPHIVVVQHFDDELKRLVPVK